jgi:hypothetical protein
MNTSTSGEHTGELQRYGRFLHGGNLCTSAASMRQMARLQHLMMSLPLSIAANCLWNEHICLSCAVVMSTHLLA